MEIKKYFRHSPCGISIVAKVSPEIFLSLRMPLYRSNTHSIMFSIWAGLLCAVTYLFTIGQIDFQFQKLINCKKIKYLTKFNCSLPITRSIVYIRLDSHFLVILPQCVESSSYVNHNRSYMLAPFKKVML